MHTLNETNKPNKADKIVSFILWTTGLACAGFGALVLLLLSAISGC